MSDAAMRNLKQLEVEAVKGGERNVVSTGCQDRHHHNRDWYFADWEQHQYDAWTEVDRKLQNTRVPMRLVDDALSSIRGPRMDPATFPTSPALAEALAEIFDNKIAADLQIALRTDLADKAFSLPWETVRQLRRRLADRYSGKLQEARTFAEIYDAVSRALEASAVEHHAEREFASAEQITACSPYEIEPKA
jgi:hypothetical protein